MLRVKNLSFRYSAKSDYLWQPLSFSAGEGEIIVLRGKNGRGKSTLLNCLCGIIPRVITGDMRGEVLYKGSPVSEKPLREIAPHINMLFQEPEKQIFMPIVEEEITFGMESLCVERKEIERRLQGLMEYFRISDLRYRKTINLSFGQKKLVVLAGILAMSPEIVLVDEFSAGMGEEMVGLFLRYMEESKKKGKSYILAEHHPALLDSADLVIDLDKESLIKDEVTAPNHHQIEIQPSG